MISFITSIVSARISRLGHVIFDDSVNETSTVQGSNFVSLLRRRQEENFRRKKKICLIEILIFSHYLAFHEGWENNKKNEKDNFIIFANIRFHRLSLSFVKYSYHGGRKKIHSKKFLNKLSNFQYLFNVKCV